MKFDTSYTQNRELSWLKFNERVLRESVTNTIPVFERFKFLSIFISNLREFYMVRVGSIYDLSLLREGHIDNKSGMSPAKQLNAIFETTASLYKEKDSAYNSVETSLRLNGICNLKYSELSRQDKKNVDLYFSSYILPVLSPQIIDNRHPFPHIANGVLNIAVTLKSEDTQLFGIIPVPQHLPRFHILPGSHLRYILIEEIIYEYAESIFSMYDLTSKTIICVTRNADINPDDEGYEVDEDFRFHMKKMLKRRARLAPVRLEVYESINSQLTSYLCKKLDIKLKQVFITSSPLNLDYAYKLGDSLPAALRRSLSYEPYEGKIPLDKNESVLKQVKKKDILLKYPFDSFKPFLQLIKESAIDPNVVSIKITVYRLAKKSRLIDYLIMAAENGKEVTVVMELRARFDEQNNIEWTERLDEAGCRIIYGPDLYKVHSKICLITRKNKNRIEYITQIGTGNYNENTAKLYTDFSLITSSPEIGADTDMFFKNMAIGNLKGSYRHLLAAPVSLKTGVIKLIDREIEKAKDSKPAKIILKLNSLSDRQIINKLSEASCAGVEIKLIVRGICCILPQIPEKTENITIISIVGRFLEHSRVYCFGDDMYISSADFMTRNTERRVEIACPVYDKQVKSTIFNMLSLMFNDNVNACSIDNKGNYVEIPKENNIPVDSHRMMMVQSGESAEKKAGIQNLLKNIVSKLHK